MAVALASETALALAEALALEAALALEGTLALEAVLALQTALDPGQRSGSQIPEPSEAAKVPERPGYNLSIEFQVVGRSFRDVVRMVFNCFSNSIRSIFQTVLWVFG